MQGDFGALAVQGYSWVILVLVDEEELLRCIQSQWRQVLPWLCSAAAGAALLLLFPWEHK